MEEDSGDVQQEYVLGETTTRIKIVGSDFKSADELSDGIKTQEG